MNKDEVLKVAGEPFGYFCDWGDHQHEQRIAMYYGEPGSASVDDWDEMPQVQKNLRIYTEAQLLQVAQATYAAGEKKWKEQVIDQLVVCHILTAEHESDPKKALNDLINWNVEVALDPLVSSDAQALIDRGAADMKERGAERLTGACEKCGGEGWLWSHELDQPPQCDLLHDDTRYPCDGEMCKAASAIRALPIPVIPDTFTPTNPRQFVPNLEGEQ